MNYGAASILSRFRSCHGSIELFALEGREALNLLASNPLAGFCLAVNGEFTKQAKLWPLSAARTMMTKPQRDILAWLGFRPATEAVAKIGRKCVPESLSLDRCLRLRRTVSHDRHRHLLAHLSRVNAGVIALVSERDQQPLLTPRLLSEVAESPIEDTRAECSAFLADIRQMWREVRRDERLPALMSLNRVRALHDELIKEINRKGVRWFRGRIYPPPPLPGITTNDLIVTPITNVDDLQALGRAQHNCVASYARRVLSGNTYIYRVTAGGGHVCTLCLVKARNGFWRVAEFRGVCNRPAPPETISPLHRWCSVA
jgi:hypothetical protein